MSSSKPPAECAWDSAHSWTVIPASKNIFSWLMRKETVCQDKGSGPVSPAIPTFKLSRIKNWLTNVWPIINLVNFAAEEEFMSSYQMSKENLWLVQIYLYWMRSTFSVLVEREEVPLAVLLFSFLAHISFFYLSLSSLFPFLSSFLSTFAGFFVFRLYGFLC